MAKKSTTTAASARQAKIQAAQKSQGCGANRIVVATVVVVVAIIAVVGGVIWSQNQKEAATGTVDGRARRRGDGPGLPRVRERHGGGGRAHGRPLRGLPVPDLRPVRGRPRLDLPGPGPGRASSSSTTTCSNFLDDKTGAKNSTPAANGAFCAADDGKFQEFHNAVFASQVAEGEDVTDAQLGAWAATAGITGDALTTWQKCVADEHLHQVRHLGERGRLQDPELPGHPHRDDQRQGRRPEHDRDPRAADPGHPERHQVTSYLPSPTVGVCHLGPLPIRIYALCILVGIVVAVWLTGRRLVARGGEPGQALDVAAWARAVRHRRRPALPRHHHARARTSARAATRRRARRSGTAASASGAPSRSARSAPGSAAGARGISFLAFADAAAPGVAFAQAIGRFGNWFNNELYGGPTTCRGASRSTSGTRPPGAPCVDADGQAGAARRLPPDLPLRVVFLVVLGTLLLVVDRRRTLGHGQLFGLYVAGYPVGRIVIEKLRTDEAELDPRASGSTSGRSIVVFLLGVWIFWFTRPPGPPPRSRPCRSREPESQDVG